MTILGDKLCLVACVVTLVAGVPVGRGQDAALARPDFRICTFNVNEAEPGREITVAAIRRSGADIVCLQETTPGWERLIRNELKLHYPHMVFRHGTGRKGGGMAFLSKTEGSEVAHIPSETGWFDGWIFQFELDGKPVQVLNVHLHPPADEKGTLGLGAYLDGGEKRLAEIRRFHARLKPGVPVVVAGDFNEEEGGATGWLQKQGMESALAEFDEDTPTWQCETGIVTLRRRLDHIFISNAVGCSAARVLEAGGSDHRPVAADLWFKAAQ